MEPAGMGPQAQPEGTGTQEPAVQQPLDEARMVTVPGAAPAPVETEPAERRIPIKRGSETREVSEAELKELAEKGWDYSEKTMELAPAREMLEWLEATPGAADLIVNLMQGGMPQAQAQQVAQQQMQPQGYPQPPQQNPDVDFLVKELSELKANQMMQQFMGKHPEANFEKVVQHLTETGLDDLELAYRDMMYPELVKNQAQVQQQQQTQRASLEVQPGAAGGPDQYRVDPRKLNEAEIHEVAKRYRLIE
jgi:hypothetical protein